MTILHFSVFITAHVYLFPLFGTCCIRAVYGNSSHSLQARTLVCKTYIGDQWTNPRPYWTICIHWRIDRTVHMLIMFFFLAGEIYQCLQVEIAYNVTMFSFHMCNDNRRNKQSWRQSSHLRKRLTIFLKVHVMGCSVSKGFLQILSRVRDELNKLKREKNNVHQV